MSTSYAAIGSLSLPTLQAPILFYRGTENKTDRATLLARDNNPSNSFMGAKVHFTNTTGYFLCKSGSNREHCCLVLGKPHWRLATVLAVYVTDNDAKIIRPTRFNIYARVFGEHTYTKLRESATEALGKNKDLFLQCTINQFQRFNLAVFHTLWKDDYQKKIRQR